MPTLAPAPDASHAATRRCPSPLHRRGLVLLVLASGVAMVVAAPVAASHDPNRTATIYVHGFDRSGADRHGIYGGDIHEPVADSVAALLGLPTSTDSLGPLQSNVVAGTTYYGDLPPSYYSAADLAEIGQLTAQWGGGVPRYAYIVARYARHILERSGADQVNFVSASFGSLIVRWLIEKNVAGLAGEGRVARWLTVEGLVAGNWEASHPDLVNLLDIVAPEPIDVRHMAYGWIESNLHAPRLEADSPYYGGILIGQVGSTDDSGNSGVLRDAMLAYNDYQPNDGVQALPDTRFQNVTAQSRFSGLPPTFGVFHADHLGLQDWRSAWAEAATFITASRRVTVTMTSARVSNLHEVHLPFWNWLPAEVLFESRAYSPVAQTRWGITQPLSAYVKEGAAIPMRRYNTAGENQQFQYVLFDDLVLPGETQLRLDLRGVEVDFDPRYGVFETVQTPYYDDMGGGTVLVSTLQPGSYSFAVADWSCQLSVNVFDYPFAPLVGVQDPGPRAPVERAGALTISPNPFRSAVRITASALASDPPEGAATLVIMDMTGRVVRRVAGDVRAGFEWDGRDASGRLLPPGIYLHRLVTLRGIWHGRSCLLR